MRSQNQTQHPARTTYTKISLESVFFCFFFVCAFCLNRTIEINLNLFWVKEFTIRPCYYNLNPKLFCGYITINTMAKLRPHILHTYSQITQLCREHFWYNIRIIIGIKSISTTYRSFSNLLSSLQKKKYFLFSFDMYFSYSIIKTFPPNTILQLHAIQEMVRIKQDLL